MDHAESEPVETVTFTLDGRQVTGRKGEMLIAAAERAGTFIPRFCYHPRMKSVGVCRMCLVEVSGPRGASLQPSCYVEVQAGSEVTTNSDKVKKAQDGVLEFLLVNHPLDCPVCDKGGECPLQDQTLAYGPGESRFVEEKRHFEKPIPISELVLLDRERCIQCSRCTRFADEVAGEAQIDFIGRGEHLEVNTFPELPFTSYFSGNTVQICPVGALTAAPYRFAARPWDLDQVESTCTTCAVGCRVAVQSSSNRVTRLLGIDADPVNHGWLCDKGRFAFDAVNSEDRLVDPLIRKEGSLVPVSWHEALAAVADGIKKATTAGGAESVGVVGGARLTNEGAYAWAKLAKGVLGTDSVDAQLGDGLPAELVLGPPSGHHRPGGLGRHRDRPVRRSCARSSRSSSSGCARPSSTGDSPWSSCRPQATSLTPVRQGVAALRAGRGHDHGHGPRGPGCTRPGLRRPRPIGRGPPAGRRRKRRHHRRAAVPGRGRCPGGRGCLRSWPVRCPKARFLPALRRGNVNGALDMGLAPGLLPGRVTLDAGRDWFTQRWGSVPQARGRDTEGILRAAAGDAGAGPQVGALIVLGADPLTDFPDRRLAERALDAADFVVAVASSPGAVTERADVVLPAAEAHERPGTTTNIEGRISRVGQKLVPPGQAWPDWMIAAELAVHLDADLGLDSVGEVWDEIERVAPAYRGITLAVLDALGTADGVVAPLTASPVSIGRRVAPLDPIAVPGVESVERQGAPPRAGLAEAPTAGLGAPAVDRSDGAGEPALPGLVALPLDLDVPHVSPVDSYSMRLVASRSLYDLGSAVSAVPALAGLVDPAPLRVNPHDLDDLGVAAGGSVRLRTENASLVAAAVPDPSLPRKVVAADFNVPLDGGTVDSGTVDSGTVAGGTVAGGTVDSGTVAGGTVADLIDSGAPLVEVRMETP